MQLKIGQRFASSCCHRASLWLILCRSAVIFLSGLCVCHWRFSAQRHNLSRSNDHHLHRSIQRRQKISTWNADKPGWPVDWHAGAHGPPTQGCTQTSLAGLAHPSTSHCSMEPALRWKRQAMKKPKLRLKYLKFKRLHHPPSLPTSVNPNTTT